MKPKALVNRTLFPEILDYLAEHVDYELIPSEEVSSKDSFTAAVQDKQGLLPLLTDRIDKQLIDAAPSLKIIANCAVGYNNIDIDYARKKGILVTNTPGVLTEATADLTWALILAVARRIPPADVFTRAKKFSGWELDLFLGQDLCGKRLGIIGMGRIGKAVSLRAQAFQMEVVYSDPHRLDSGEETRYRAKKVTLEALLRTSDVVTLHTSLTPQTYHLITREKLALMKNSAILINVSRGPVVDEDALVEALEKEIIWGAGLDVYENEPQIHPGLLNLNNTVLLPHIGSATRETRQKMAKTAAMNLVLALEGKSPPNRIV
jgi:glyoxylate reductase